MLSGCFYFVRYWTIENIEDIEANKSEFFGW